MTDKYLQCECCGYIAVVIDMVDHSALECPLCNDTPCVCEYAHEDGVMKEISPEEFKTIIDFPLDNSCVIVFNQERNPTSDEKAELQRAMKSYVLVEILSGSYRALVTKEELEKNVVLPGWTIGEVGKLSLFRE